MFDPAGNTATAYVPISVQYRRGCGNPYFYARIIRLRTDASSVRTGMIAERTLPCLLFVVALPAYHTGDRSGKVYTRYGIILLLSSSRPLIRCRPHRLQRPYSMPYRYCTE